MLDDADDALRDLEAGAHVEHSGSFSSQAELLWGPDDEGPGQVIVGFHRFSEVVVDVHQAVVDSVSNFVVHIAFGVVTWSGSDELMASRSRLTSFI